MAIKKGLLDVVINSSEELGVLDTGFLEDFYGVDGFLTLRHSGGLEFSVGMANVAGGGPFINDHFEGVRDATVMPLGMYEARGRVRDIVGNYTILSAFGAPNGLEGVQVIRFNLIDLQKLISAPAPVYRFARDAVSVYLRVADSVRLVRTVTDSVVAI